MKEKERDKESMTKGMLEIMKGKESERERKENETEKDNRKRTIKRMSTF